MDDRTTQKLIGAALSLADSVEWEVTDSGHAAVRSDYELTSALVDAAEAYRAARKLPAGPNIERRVATRGLASLMRNQRPRFHK